MSSSPSSVFLHAFACMSLESRSWMHAGGKTHAALSPGHSLGFTRTPPARCRRRTQFTPESGPALPAGARGSFARVFPRLTTLRSLGALGSLGTLGVLLAAGLEPGRDRLGLRAPAARAAAAPPIALFGGL